MPKVTVVSGYAPCAGQTHDHYPCLRYAMRDYPFVGHAPRCWHHEAKFMIDKKRRPADAAYEQSAAKHKLQAVV